MTLVNEERTALCARALLLARGNSERVRADVVRPESAEEAYAIQDATLQALGPIGGWKVGARSVEAEPTCAPLPAGGLLPAGAVLSGPAWRLRGIEVEVAFRLRHDLPPRCAAYTRDDLAFAIDAVYPVIEVVETRLDDWLSAGPRAQLADLVSHGALIVGQRRPFEKTWLRLSSLEVRLRFGEQRVAHTVGGHPCPDAGHLLTWLANHCSQRNRGLKAGQILTTGSCTGMLFASAGASIDAVVEGLGEVSLSF